MRSGQAPTPVLPSFELGLVVVEAMGAEEALGGAVGSSVVLWGSSASARDQARNRGIPAGVAADGLQEDL